MTQLVYEYSIDRAGETLVLLPNKLVWWPSQRLLFVADLHLGKAATFRQAGLPVPGGTTQRMLNDLSKAIETYQAAGLVILGDMIHSLVRAATDYEEELRQWRLSCQTSITLVKGNHDKLPQAFYDNLNIATVEAPFQLGPFELNHYPKVDAAQSFMLCGHVHPAIRLGKQQAPCFWLQPNQLVLPAFGVFTGTKKILLVDQESAIVVCDDGLLPITKP